MHRPLYPKGPRPAAAKADPAELTIRSLQVWPDGELYQLARALATELRRRQLPTLAALPVTAVAIGLPDLCLPIG
jgi:hypothetical protein